MVYSIHLDQIQINTIKIMKSIEIKVLIESNDSKNNLSDASGLASSVYYRLMTGEYVETRKLVLAK